MHSIWQEYKSKLSGNDEIVNPNEFIFKLFKLTVKTTRIFIFLFTTIIVFYLLTLIVPFYLLPPFFFSNEEEFNIKCLMIILQYSAINEHDMELKYLLKTHQNIATPWNVLFSSIRLLSCTDLCSAWFLFIVFQFTVHFSSHFRFNILLFIVWVWWWILEILWMKWMVNLHSVVRTLLFILLLFSFKRKNKTKLRVYFVRKWMSINYLLLPFLLFICFCLLHFKSLSPGDRHTQNSELNSRILKTPSIESMGTEKRI